MSTAKPYILAAVVLLLAGAIYFIGSKNPKMDVSDEVVARAPRSGSSEEQARREEKAKRYEPAKEITTPDGFINTNGQPITIGDFIGKKVVLIDFWTYSCINCQRTTPYLNAWYEKYKDDGLIIIGIHTPEFAFEKEYGNVQAAVDKLGIKFPVVLDNNYSTWTAYKNQYWPRKYLIDIDGFIVYDHIGEGGYDETERKIQDALGERQTVLGEVGSAREALTEDAPLPSGPRSPEVYFGAARNQLLGNGMRGTIGSQNGLTVPANPQLNTLYLTGDWDISDEFAENKTSNAKIIFRYQGKQAHFVAGSETGTKVRVFKDGAFAGEHTVRVHTLYTLIDDANAGEHTLEIIIENPGLRAFTFTFG